MKQNYVKKHHDSKPYRAHTLHLGPNRAQRRAERRAGLPSFNNPYRKQSDGSLAPRT